MIDHLIKFGDTWLPEELLMSDGWQPVPNQRTELQAFRDANINLHRVTSANYKTSLTITLTPMNKTDKERVQAIIKSGMVNEIERKVLVTYWNDEDNQYKTGYFYIPDISFQTLGFFGGERWYKSVTIQLIEY